MVYTELYGVYRTIWYIQNYIVYIELYGVYRTPNLQKWPPNIELLTYKMATQYRTPNSQK
jgi:hypothetical protein